MTYATFAFQTIFNRKLLKAKFQRYAHDAQSTHICFSGLMKTSKPFTLTLMFLTNWHFSNILIGECLCYFIYTLARHLKEKTFDIIRLPNYRMDCLYTDEIMINESKEIIKFCRCE